jgi:hypothetical protein
MAGAGALGIGSAFLEFAGAALNPVDELTPMLDVNGSAGATDALADFVSRAGDPLVHAG